MSHRHHAQQHLRSGDHFHGAVTQYPKEKVARKSWLHALVSPGSCWGRASSKARFLKYYYFKVLGIMLFHKADSVLCWRYTYIHNIHRNPRLSTGGISPSGNIRMEERQILFWDMAHNCFITNFITFSWEWKHILGRKAFPIKQTFSEIFAFITFYLYKHIQGKPKRAPTLSWQLLFSHSPHRSDASNKSN